MSELSPAWPSKKFCAARHAKLREVRIKQTWKIYFSDQPYAAYAAYALAWSLVAQNNTCQWLAEPRSALLRSSLSLWKPRTGFGFWGTNIEEEAEALKSAERVHAYSCSIFLQNLRKCGFQPHEFCLLLFALTSHQLAAHRTTCQRSGGTSDPVCLSTRHSTDLYSI